MLLWAVYFSIMSLFFLGPSPNPLNVAGSAPLLVVSATVFLLPIRGLHERLRAEKEEQLTWVLLPAFV